MKINEFAEDLNEDVVDMVKKNDFSKLFGGNDRVVQGSRLDPKIRSGVQRLIQGGQLKGGEPGVFIRAFMQMIEMDRGDVVQAHARLQRFARSVVNRLPEPDEDEQQQQG